MLFSTASTFPAARKPLFLLLGGYLLTFLIIWGWTLMYTTDLNNWIIENTLTFLFLGFLVISYKKYPLSDLSYTFIFVYLLLHIYGAMYTYAENPLGYWLQDIFNTSRNHYDRIVHFSFGFMLAYPMRDIFLNTFRFPPVYSWILPAEITLSFSGMYELIEWAVAEVIFPSQGTAYLGTQGDPWDAQKDMALAWSGSIIILLITFLVRRLKIADYSDNGFH